MRIASANEAGDPSMKRSDKAGAETTEASIDNTVPDARTIRDFLARARRAGSTMARESDRRAAQRILDYWSAELVTRPGITSADVSPARLAAFASGLETAEPVAVAVDSEPASREIDDPGAVAIAVPESVAVATKDSAVSGDGFASDDELSSDELTERFRIRVAAQARQWKNTGYPGYLLRGEALKEASELPQGPDIAEFVEASAKAETDSQKQRDRSKNILIALFATAALILAATTYFAYLQRNDAFAAQEQALQKANEIRRLNDDLSAALKEATSARDQAVQARDAALDKAKDADKRLAELQATQVILRSAIVLVVEQLKLGNVSLDKLSQDLQQGVLVELAGQVKSGEITLEQLSPPLRTALEPLLGTDIDKQPNVLSGYKVDFIGATIGLPRITGELRSDAVAPPLDYINYSLVMGRSHRMAIYSAVNLDRPQRLPLQVTASRLKPDGRLPVDFQPRPSWYFRADRPWLAARFASASDIAWGPEFAGDSATAALKLAQYASFLPNTMPQPRAFYGGQWLPLESWVRSQHNPLANRVTIFSGPVFRPADQPVDGVPVPYAYWKLAVSSVPAAVKGEISEPEFVVDAFFIPADATGAFDPERYRLPVAELEKRTSLNFGTLIEWTDSVKNPGPNGTAADALAGRVKLLDSADGASDALRGGLIAVLGNPDLPVPERRKIVAALVKMAGLQSMTGLTPAGRRNVLEALLGVPADLWSRPDWLPVFAAARRAVADLDTSAADGQAIIGDQDRAALNTLKDRLHIQQRPQTAYVQFAGMTREDAQALSAKMRALGWGIPTPGEERVAAAAGKNEVRYKPDNDADRSAAELLAADLTAAGQPVTARAVPVIGANTLEIWISI
ncbi:DNA/RNA non-specific endonuclease [Mesorhizobium caraganae]|uniref:DNA/RNA non-specific endonuclease n=1 Tax=Mesorhizobium caraganae TaxID=483206 RepID=UPI00193A0C6E|nr:DNA/RNA non-specific endonuclease [Mesorhizobium caraganae]MBM2711713.1 DNA/RNA non-specific endonuclease [Mesorhizobium caraganae]